MIKVNVRELRITGSDAYKNIDGKVFNAAGVKFSKIIHEKLKGHSCEHHPDYENILTLIIKENENPELEKTDFCCEYFKNKIGVTISNT